MKVTIDLENQIPQNATTEQMQKLATTAKLLAIQADAQSPGIQTLVTMLGALVLDELAKQYEIADDLARAAMSDTTTEAE